MLPESLFVPASGRPTLSVLRSLQRRLGLLETVLPTFLAAAIEAWPSTRQFSPSRDFWTEIITNCMLIAKAGGQLNGLNNQHEDLVNRSLQSLELLVDLDKLPISEECDSSHFPCMETLRRHILDNPMDAENILKGNVKEPALPNIRKSIVQTLAELERAVKDDSKQPLLEDDHSAAKLKPLMGPFLLNLLSTVSSYFHCKCVKPHKAILLLSTHRSIPKNAESHEFTLLLSRGLPGHRWQETRVIVKEPLPTPPVKFFLPDSVIDESETLNPVKDLCENLKSARPSRLNLNVDGASLFQLAHTDLALSGLENSVPVSLAEGVIGNESELAPKGRLCLAFVLSYALLDFCGEPWFPSGWTKKGIWCLQTGGQLLLRPALVTHMRSPSAMPRPSRSSNDLRLLFHGILMMEIFNQAEFPLQIDVGEDADINNLRNVARHEFDAVNWDVYEGFQQSVEACINGNRVDDVDPAATSEDSFVATFCRIVLRPLATDFHSVWGNRDPDEAILELKMPSIKKLPGIGRKPLHLQTFRGRPVRPTNPKPPISPRFSQLTHAAMVPSMRPERVRFFDAVDTMDAQQNKRSSKWFAMFDQQHIQASLPRRPKTKEQGTRIAVLDTGIDLENAWISSNRGRIQCWPNDKACEDTDGHGTQVAYLLLRLAPHVQLRIAKISGSGFIEDVNIEEIAKAIRHYSSRDSNHVDILNLSFGFPLFGRELHPILDALSAARANNVLIFAAAGNQGGNQGIFWPAKLHETDKVICINAADGNGNASGFNPTIGSGHHRICTLGEAVPSCERDVHRQVMIHRSGTSFATPIAAAIAAIVLGFVDGASPSVDPAVVVEEARALAVPADFDALKLRLRTKLGMEKVLCKTCVQQGEDKRAGFSYIAPWFFIEIDEQSRIGIIANELRNMPE